LAPRTATSPIARRSSGLKRRARRLLDDLLVAALDGAVTLEEVDHVAVLVAEHLDLDVARPDDGLLDVDRVVAERAQGLAARALERGPELFCAVHEAHALAAAAGGRLEHHRVADARGRGERLVERVGAPARGDGHAGLGHLRARARLRAHDAHRARGRADERDPGAIARLH
jgi:hypothetical protein